MTTQFARITVHRDISMRSYLTIEQSWQITDEIEKIDEEIAAIDDQNDFVTLQLQERRKDLRQLLQINDQPIFVRPAGLWAHIKAALFGPDQIARNLDDDVIVPNYPPTSNGE